MKKIILFIMLLLTCSCTSQYVNTFHNVDNVEVINKIKNEKYYLQKNYDKYLSYSILNNVSSYDIVREVNVGLYRDYYKQMIATDTSKDILMLVNKYNYLNYDYVPNDLEIISDKCNIGINSYLRHEARVEFEKLCNDAKKEGLNIYSLSAYRSYEKQYNIYKSKLQNKDINTIDAVSARPGNSEHQSGLTVDINLLSKEFDKTNEYYWMINNSYKYGFILRYPRDCEKITGYDYEPWHYRYVGREAANKIHEENITFDEYYAYYIDDN